MKESLTSYFPDYATVNKIEKWARLILICFLFVSDLKSRKFETKVRTAFD